MSLDDGPVHHLDEVDEYRIAVIDQGEYIQVGNSRADHGGPAFKVGKDLQFAADKFGLLEFHVFGIRFHFALQMFHHAMRMTSQDLFHVVDGLHVIFFSLQTFTGTQAVFDMVLKADP